ncbi:MAG: DnaB-like helicase C-terminal domain-containing protein [Candidatus Neptunochlamydia sp.]|nr:DnaB-like helicase C-terminal domain-containing protein [Candidatus Neptunochlamydia sp.]
MLSDLRESGAIEADADVVIFLLRREYYDPYDKPGLAEIIIGKNRHGKVGNIEMAYRKEFAQFSNYTPADGHSSEEAFEAFSPYSESSRPPLIDFGEFKKIKLSQEEYEALSSELGQEDLDRIITEADSYLEKNQTERKDSKAYLLKWFERQKSFSKK